LYHDSVLTVFDWKVLLNYIDDKLESIKGNWNWKPQSRPYYQVEIGPHPTRAHFWPAVNKRPTRLWTRYFLTHCDKVFLDPKEKNWKFEIYGWNFPDPDPEVAVLIRLRQKKITWPGSKNFCPYPSQLPRLWAGHNILLYIMFIPIWWRLKSENIAKQTNKQGCLVAAWLGCRPVTFFFLLVKPKMA